MQVEVTAMKVLLQRVLLVAVPLVLVLVVSAAASGLPSRKLEHTKRPVVAMAIDGSRVAYSTDQNAVFVWNVLTGKTTRARGVHLGTGASIPQLAVAGTRVAWILTHVAGNSEETRAQLMTSSPTGAGRRVVASAFRIDGYNDNGVQVWDGTWLTGLAGSGNVLAVSRWTTQHNAISDERLSLIDSKGRLRVIASGPGTIASVAADARRIAVLRPDGTVGMFSSAGGLLLNVTPSSVQEVALGGGKLVVLTGTRKTLEVYDSTSGKLLHVWELATGRAGNLRAYGRIGVYSTPFGHSSQYLHVIDLLTGKEFVLPNTHHPWAVPALVGRLGLVYGIIPTPFPGHTGTLVFLPARTVLAKLGD
jgi:WD40 repeat protein